MRYQLKLVADYLAKHYVINVDPRHVLAHLKVNCGNVLSDMTASQLDDAIGEALDSTLESKDSVVLGKPLNESLALSYWL